MVCIRCQKRPAIIFVQRMENGQMKNEGYCLHCAREMHIKPVDDLMKQFGMSDEDMDAMEDRMENKSGRFPGVGDIPVLGEIFTTRNNSSTKTELVVILRPTVIRDASIDGDFSHLATSLPDGKFFTTDKVYEPFSGPQITQEPLR